ncbi:MAG TPA: hypothetical protein VMX75_12510, partial [Spirochaetia bacterium]|nr:hypothetical protein [Spirochaetia bacterium]
MASLVSAIALHNPDTSFTERFRPDWAHDAIFLSHMGEMNYTYGDADNPVIATGRFKAGEVLLLISPPSVGGNRLNPVSPVLSNRRWPLSCCRKRLRYREARDPL